VAGGDYGENSITAANVAVTATDDDTAGVTVSVTALNIAEEGGTQTYTLVLDSQPSGDVKVTPTSSDPTVARVSPALTFTTENWFVPQDVIVTSVDDDIDNDPDRTATVTHGASGGGYDSVTVASVTVTILDDNNPPGVTISSSSGISPRNVGTSIELRLAEAATGTYTVVLNGKPTADVMVTPMSSDLTVATVSGVLTFTPANWN